MKEADKTDIAHDVRTYISDSLLKTKTFRCRKCETTVPNMSYVQDLDRRHIEGNSGGMSVPTPMPKSRN